MGLVWNRIWIVVLVLTAIIGIVANVRAFHDYVFEDAYITYVYAQNVATGQGLVFNAGERLLGTTTPFYALLLGLLARLGADIPTASGLIFAVSMAVIGLVGGVALLRRGAPSAGLLFNLAMALGVGNWTWQWGMETAFYTATLFVAWMAAIHRRPWLAGMGLGIAFVTRYDGVLFALALMLMVWVRDRRPPLRIGFASLAVVVPWLAFAQVYYGSVLPYTLSAKKQKTAFVEYLLGAAVRQAENLLSPLLPMVPARLHPPLLVHVLGLLVLALALYAAIRIWRHPTVSDLGLERALGLVPLLFVLALWLGYSIIGPGIGHSWHLLPAVPFVLLLALFGAGRLLARAIRWRTMQAFAALVLAVGIASVWPLANARAEDLMDRDFYRGRIGSYEDIARFVNARGLGDLRVMMQEPGYFRYLAGNPMVDTAGLVTRRLYDPESGRPSGNINRLVDTYQPDLIVAPQRYWPKLDFSEFMPLMHAMPLRTVYIRRSTYESRFESLAGAWRSGASTLSRSALEMQRPIEDWTFDLSTRQAPGWNTTGRLWGGYVTDGTATVHRDLPIEPPVLSTVGRQWGGLVSPPFLIEFDELRFRFTGTSRTATEVRLLIDGQAVLSETGTDADPTRAESIDVRDVRWQVQRWRGRTASLQLVDIDPEADFVAVSNVRTCVHEGATVLDDFEREAYGERWVETFARRPRANRRLARQQGVHFLIGAYAASSYGVGGRRQLVSAPFLIEGEQLGFLAFDFGDHSNRVELLVDGDVVRAWHGEQTFRLRSVVWDVAAFRGREAVLRATDGDARPSRWLGIDDIRGFDTRCR